MIACATLRSPNHKLSVPPMVLESVLVLLRRALVSQAQPMASKPTSTWHPGRNLGQALGCAMTAVVAGTTPAA